MIALVNIRVAEEEADNSDKALMQGLMHEGSESSYVD